MDKEKAQTPAANNGQQDKVYWHDSFTAALKLEFHEYTDALIFEDKHALSKEALEIDILVIKRAAHTPINKNIGRIFKGHNIFEYKSETVNLTKWDYHKVSGGYAMLYSAFEKVPLEDITVSFVVTPKPVKLFEYLTSTRGFEVVEASPGIYQVHGDAFPVQIIENKKLAADENVFLKSLQSSLSHKDVDKFINAYINHGELDRANVLVSRVYSANQKTFEEALAMNHATFDEFIDDVIRKKGGIDKIIEEKAYGRAMHTTTLEMLKRGYDTKEISDIVRMPFEWVKNLEKELVAN